MAIVTVGIDLAKNVFAVHGVDESGKSILIRPSVKRAALLELVAKLPPCLIGMEACSGAHHWAREFAKFGHTARLIAPKFVTPYGLSGKKGKNDAADAQVEILPDPVFPLADESCSIRSMMSGRVPPSTRGTEQMSNQSVTNSLGAFAAPDPGQSKFCTPPTEPTCHPGAPTDAWTAG